MKWPDDYLIPGVEPFHVEEAGIIYCADCRDILPKLPKVDLVITSPPYDQQRNYGGNKINDWNSLMCDAFNGIKVEGNTQILVNLGQIHKDGEVYLYYESWRDYMRQLGWRFFGNYIWDQGDGLPGNWNGRFAPSHEIILHFNVNSVGINKWVKVKKQRGPTGTGLRGKDCKTKGISSPNKCGQPFKIPDSVIRIYRQMARNGYERNHPAVYPLELPKYLINSFPKELDLILDPFLGSGTTAVAAKELGRRFIGIEIDPTYCAIAVKRLRQGVLNFGGH